MKGCFSLITCTAALAAASNACGQVQTFRNDYAGFMRAAGHLRVVDFETLPDGRPSRGGEQITESFNYDSQGVHFSALDTTLSIGGNPVAGFTLAAYLWPTFRRTWINADIAASTHAAGIFFPGGTQLCAYNDAGAELACVSYDSYGGGLFLGIVANDDISRVVVDRGSSFEEIESFHFAPLPEPGGLVLMALGFALAVRRRVKAPATAGGEKI